MKVRRWGRIVSRAVTMAVGVNGDGRREVLGLDIGLSEAESFRTGFLRSAGAGAACAGSSGSSPTLARG